jgi:hypothetical protein
MTKPYDDGFPSHVNQWGDTPMAEAMAQAVPTSVCRDIARDALRGLAPRSALPETPRTFADAPRPETVPTYREWYFRRYGSEVTEAKAKQWYHTEKTAGRDVGKGPMPQSPTAGPAANNWGNVPLVPIGPPPGVAQLDRLMDHQDRLDRADRARNGRW